MVNQWEAMVCPRPRRLGEVAGCDGVGQSVRWQLCSADTCDSKMDVLDIILAKDASSPPYFCGSPPTRSTNPQVQDARFGEMAAPPQPPATAAAVAAPSSGGCVRTDYGPLPAAVRIEGFDCLGADRRRSRRGITAVA